MLVSPSDSLFISLIIPVYNRPHEVEELLESLKKQTQTDFEVVLIEDGSTVDCRSVAEEYSDSLQISYYYKENSGPGSSRNYGMKRAKGTYFIILDSDCILPPNYIQEAYSTLTHSYVDCFGGIDTAMESFTDIQKAINFAMTSFLTTGGIRGGSEKLGKFQPRSFNMGISKKAFEASGGFSKIHPGEDPDLSIRLWKLGYETRLFKNLYVYHKRRIDWKKFRIQVTKFGMVRPILNQWYPEYSKPTFWFPSIFVLCFVFSVLFSFFYPIFLYLYGIYFLFGFLLSSFQNKSIKIGFLSIWAIFIQFYGYGIGFLRAYFRINIQRRKPEQVFPHLFFK